MNKEKIIFLSHSLLSFLITHPPNLRIIWISVFQKKMYCSIVTNVRTRKTLKNAINGRRRRNAKRKRFGRIVWRLANDAQVVQAIKCLIPTILMNVFAQETLSLTPMIQTDAYAQETKFPTMAILVIVFALLIRLLTLITHSSAFVITANYQTWPGNAVNISFYMTYSINISKLHCKFLSRGIIAADHSVTFLISMLSYHTIHVQSCNDCHDSLSGYYDQLSRSLKTTKRNVVLQLVLGSNYMQCDLMSVGL